MVPLGLQTHNLTQLKNVAVVLTKALTYQNCSEDLFKEDTSDISVAQDSLTQLEVLVLCFEHWAASFLDKDTYLLGLTVGLLEVLVHSVAFWARLKQSAVLAKMLLQIQDFDTEGVLKQKAVKIISAIG